MSQPTHNRHEELRRYDDATPKSMGWLDDGSVTIEWEDGESSLYRRPFLRANCPCATCKGTHGPPTTLVATKAKKGSFNILAGPKPPPRNVAFEIKAVEPVGRYAIRFTWGDGHDTGIYAFRYLRLLSAESAASEAASTTKPADAPA
jgi:DUF971 family protein